MNTHRHLTSAPERGEVILQYGCSKCLWSYWPKSVTEARQISWVAMTQFEAHVCAQHGTKVTKHGLRRPIYDETRLVSRGWGRHQIWEFGRLRDQKI